MSGSSRCVVLSMVGLLACGDEFTSGSPTSSGTTANGPGGSSTTGTGGGGTGGAAPTGGHGGTGGAPQATHPHVVSVRDQTGAPVARVPVATNRGTGEVFEVAATDSLGNVTVEVPAGGYVSAFWTIENEHHVDAVLSPPPEAAIELIIRRPAAPAPQPTTYHVTSWDHGGASTITAVGNCDSKSVPVDGTVELDLDNEDCLEDPTQNIIVTSVDSAGALTKWLVHAALPVDPGNAVEAYGAVDDASKSSVALSTSDIPGFATGTTVGAAACLGTACYTASSGAATSGEFEAVAEVPPIPAATFRWWHEVSWPQPNGTSTTRKSQEATVLPPSSLFSALTYFSLTLEALDTADATHPVFSWSSPTQGEADFVLARIAWNAGDGTHVYTLRLPPGSSDARVPDVPSDLIAYAPSSSSAFSTRSVAVVDEAGLSGYGDFLDGAKPVPADGPSFTARAEATE
jgi:hypothetical protein